jgi:hypothetical protein
MTEKSGIDWWWQEEKRREEDERARVRRDQTKAAEKMRTERKLQRIRRAAALKADGLSAPVIGIRMALEEGRPPDRPYGERQVRRWLAEAKKG